MCFSQKISLPLAPIRIIFIIIKVEKKKKDKIRSQGDRSRTWNIHTIGVSCFGEMSRERETFYKKLSEKFWENRNISTSEATCFIRTKLSFPLIKLLVLCIRGSRSVRENQQSCPIDKTDIALSNEEEQLSLLNQNIQQPQCWI